MSEHPDPLRAIAGAVQHELNNLLAVMHGNVDLLRRTTAPEARLRQCDRLDEVSRRLELSVGALLRALQRPPGTMTEVALDEAVTAIEPLLRLALPALGTLTLDLRTGARVRLDRAALEAALLRAAQATALSSAPQLRIAVAGADLTLEGSAVPVDALAGVAPGVETLDGGVLTLSLPAT